MSIYADTSFLISLYLSDSHSLEARRSMAVNPSMWLTPLHLAEWNNTVELHVFRRAISRSEADAFHKQFMEQRNAGLWMELALPETAFDLCAELSRRHTANLGVRTLDTLHVACALELRAEAFWTFDERQTRLARAEKLKTG